MDFFHQITKMITGENNDSVVVESDTNRKICRQTVHPLKDTDAAVTLPHEECQYLDLIRHIMQHGSLVEGRNGKTYSSFGQMMRFSLANGTMPILTTKRVAWKTCFRELMWFVRGSTDNAELRKENVHIWDANSSREFLDEQGFTHRQVDDLGPVYGHQWRFFNAPYVDNHTDYSGKGVDQLQYIISNLKDPAKRSSRRLILSAWNPCQLFEMALPPCHLLCQFYVREDKYLSCSLYQRSGDVGLGIPFNIASYSFLTHLLAHFCGLEAESFVHFIGDAHIYVEHLDALREQLLRNPKPFPQIEIVTSGKREKIEDYTERDISWKTPYEHHSVISMEMKA